MNTQAKKAAEAAAKPVSKKAALLDDSTEETDPTLYFENRVKGLNAKKAKGQNPYPHKFNVTLTLPECVAKYANLEAGQRLDDVTVSVAGASKTPAAAAAAGRHRHTDNCSQPALTVCPALVVCSWPAYDGLQFLVEMLGRTSPSPA
jgi:hypothetical protein